MEKRNRIRDKERSNQKLIRAVGKILGREGHKELKINKISTVSGVSKKVIYDNFGTVDGLLKAYFDQVDFWKIKEKDMKVPGMDAIPEITKDFMFNLIRSNFEYFDKSKEMQKLVLWGISEKNKMVNALMDEREALGAKVFAKSDEQFEGSIVDYRAIVAILLSSIYYTVLHSKANSSPMNGIDVSTKEGKERILKSVNQLLEWTYEKKSMRAKRGRK
ncbi:MULTISPECIES: TetR/AcrR family transcriptional regulator [Chitinophagaceae]